MMTATKQAAKPCMNRLCIPVGFAFRKIKAPAEFISITKLLFQIALFVNIRIEITK